MATTISVSCPKCKKSIQAPDSIQGKKIKCKGCGEVFPAVASGPAGKPTISAKGKPEPTKPGAKLETKEKSKPKGGDDEEWGVVNAYGVTTGDEAPRCPFCAWELEDPDDVLCLKCGYNLQTRERLEEKIIEPVTGGDYFLWLLPGIACAIVALNCLADIIFSLVLLIMPPEGWEGSSFYRMVIIYSSIFTGFIGFFTGRFAVKRLILNPHPPDKEKKLKKEEPGK